MSSKLILMFTILICSNLGAQNNVIAVSGGLNRIFSYDDQAVFGDGSPWDNRIRYSANLSYAYLLPGDFQLKLSAGIFELGFYKAGDGSVGNRFVNQYLEAGMGMCYSFDIANSNKLVLGSGINMWYNFRQVSFSESNNNYRRVTSLSWDYRDVRYFGVHSAIEYWHNIFRRRGQKLYLTGLLRAVHVFNFAPSVIKGNDDRVMLELSIGIAFRFGDNRERF